MVVVVGLRAERRMISVSAKVINGMVALVNPILPIIALIFPGLVL